ncbi:hypothetical protein Apmu_0130_07 [Acidiphilium multivorum AIU301]|nr:hypothetical protein Apmu_0130_07 [Acidiphilium multivorum AIU301]
MERDEQRCFGSKTARRDQGYEAHGSHLQVMKMSDDAAGKSAASVLAAVKGKARPGAPPEPRRP